MLTMLNLNCFLITDSSHKGIAKGVYPMGSMFNHSCLPNVMVDFKGKDIHLKTIENIPPDSQLFIS